MQNTLDESERSWFPARIRCVRAGSALTFEQTTGLVPRIRIVSVVVALCLITSGGGGSTTDAL